MVIMIYVPVQILVNDCCLMSLNSVFFQLYHGENKVIFNEMMYFVLDQHV